MRDALSRVARPYLGRAARLRWLHLVLGGAVLMPYFLVALTVVEASNGGPSTVGLLVQFRAFGLSLLLVAMTAFFSMVRTFEVSAARLLLGERAASLTPGPPISRGGRARAAVWFVVHLAAGAVVSALTLALPPATVVLVASPFVDLRPAAFRDAWPLSLPAWQQALAGLVLLAVLLGVARATGGGLARLAPALLGPSPSDRLAELERRTARLAERNRLARELHDSVGHALSVVTIQAGAAGRVIDTDPAFAARAIGAIEETARSALADLDHVLGLLREESSGTAPSPDLAGLDRLLDQARLGGLVVDTKVAGDPALLPVVVSREAYRVVQEGLTNALRHAGAGPVRLRIDVRPSILSLELTNALVADRAPAPGGGRGLAGIAERVESLGGRVSAGVDGARWRVAVEVPL